MFVLELAMGISVEEVRKVAMLARLLLDDEELQAMSEQLTKILDYMELLRRVETSNVEPLAHQGGRGDAVANRVDRHRLQEEVAEVEELQPEAAAGRSQQRAVRAEADFAPGVPVDAAEVVEHVQSLLGAWRLAS